MAYPPDQQEEQNHPRDEQKEAKPYRVTPAYLAAVVFIFICTSCAWLYLGNITQRRTEDRDYKLRAEVGRLWGGEHNQTAPSITLMQQIPPRRPSPKCAAKDQASPCPAPKAPQAVPVACESPEVLSLQKTLARVNLDLEHRRKGLLWYSTYAVVFDGTYTIKNPTPCERVAEIVVPFPASGAIYDEFSLFLDGKAVPMELEPPSKGRTHTAGAVARVFLGPGRSHQVRTRYQSRGLDRWNYSFGKSTAQAKNFKMVVQTNFEEIDFPAGTLSPSRKQPSGSGWELTWTFNNLLADAGIAVQMPQKINPGPLSAEISRFAPVSLFFFFFVLLLAASMRQVRLHPVHYGLLAAAFFAFHLLMAYLVDLIPLWAAFSIASVTSVALVTSYLRLVAGSRFALLWAGGAQLLYLVLFSLAFFMEGYTGLTITIFSILTLFVVMQLTAHIDWSTKFGKPTPTSFSPPPPRPPPDPQIHPVSSISATPLSPTAADAQAERVFSRVG